MKFHKNAPAAYIHRIINRPVIFPATLIYEQICEEPIVEMVSNDWAFSDYVAHNYANNREDIAQEATEDLFGGVDVYTHTTEVHAINVKSSNGNSIKLKKGDIDHIINKDINYVAYIRYTESKVYYINCANLMETNYWKSKTNELVLTSDMLYALNPISIDIPKDLNEYCRRCNNIKSNQSLSNTEKCEQLFSEFYNTFGFHLFFIDVVAKDGINKCFPI